MDRAQILARSLARRYLLHADQYYKKVLTTQRASLLAYWPLWEASGSVADNFEGTAARDGSYTGVTLGQPGIGDGRTSPFFDGVNDYVNVFSGSFRDAFNGQELTIAGWAKVNEASVWSDGAMRQCIRLLVDGNNHLYIRKTTTNNLLGFYYKGGGTATLAVTTTLSTTSWFHWAMTISKTANEMKAYINGSQVGTTQSGFGAWVGLLNASQCCIGAAITTPSEVWHGWLPHFAVWSTPLTAPQIARLVQV